MRPRESTGVLARLAAVGSIREVRDAVRSALPGLPIDDLQWAGAAIEEAATLVYQLAEGSNEPELPETIALYGRAREHIDTALALCDQARQHAEAYLVAIQAGDAPHTTIPAGQTAAPSRAEERPDPGADHVEELRGELPPPVDFGKGQRTHGRWISARGQRPQEILSCRDEQAKTVQRLLTEAGCPRRPTRTGDVEMKIAAIQATGGPQHTTVVLNNTPCKGDLGCDTLVPILLPKGYTMTVYGPRGYRKTFTGGAKPWWR